MRRWRAVCSGGRLLKPFRCVCTRCEMNRHTTAVLLLLMTAIGLSACDQRHGGAGPMRTETRPVESFDSIDLEGAVRLEVAVGGQPSLTVEGRDEFVQRLKSEVRGNTLYIRNKRRDWVSLGISPRLTLKVTVPHLASLNLAGGNDVLLTGFNGGGSKLHLEGATNLKGVGQLNNLSVFMAGAGHADLKDLVADDTKV